MIKELIERHRGYIDDIDWWDDVEEKFKAGMAEIGLRVDRIYFSGFSSQGDGACFEGAVDHWGKLLHAMGVKTNPVMVEFLQENATAQLIHRGRYYHEHSIQFDLYVPEPDEEWSGYTDQLRAAAWVALATYDYESLRNDLMEFCRDKMLDLYDKLEAEYDYLTSDEAVWEFIIANDLCKQERDAA
jgi:hypothetical protein